MNEKTILSLFLAVLFAQPLWAAPRRSVRAPRRSRPIHDGKPCVCRSTSGRRTSSWRSITRTSPPFERAKCRPFRRTSPNSKGATPRSWASAATTSVPTRSSRKIRDPVSVDRGSGGQGHDFTGDRTASPTSSTRRGRPIRRARSPEEQELLKKLDEMEKKRP